MKRFWIVVFLLALTSRGFAQWDGLSAPSSVVGGVNVGTVLPSCDFFSGENAIPLYASQSIKYLLTSPGDSWKQVAYGLPYYGLGAEITQFGDPDHIGNPISLYLVQGATLSHLRQNLNLNYELNLGFSAGWKPYHPFDNRENTAIGSEMNVHAAIGLYLKWMLSERGDLNIGAKIFHASNGASRQPNMGINTASLYVEYAYKINRDQNSKLQTPSIEIPHFEPHFEHDVQVIISSRNEKADNDVPIGINDHEFSVYGINYYSMRATNYKYKYGVGAEILYDESSNASIYRRWSDIDEIWYELTDLAPFGERLSVSVALRGEMVMPLYSLFFDLGYSVIQSDESSRRLYQSLGIKIPIQSNIYGTFGVRTTEMSIAQFLYWSVGYTFNRTRHSPRS